MPYALLFLAFAGVTVQLLAVAVLAARMWAERRRRTDAPRRRASVTVLKPIKGADEDLEANLESMYRQRDVVFDVIVGVGQLDDPGLAIAQRVAERVPEVPTTLVVGGRIFGKTGQAVNPKVENLANMLPFAHGELLLISDANVRVRPEYLARTVDEMDRAADRPVGLVTNMVVGVGEASLGAALENLHLSAFGAPAQALARTVARVTPVVGKSMLMRRAALEAAGGLAAVKDVLAEDHVLGQRIESAGYSVRLSSEPVANVNRHISVRAFLSRHARWMKMRAVLHPAGYFAELLALPMAFAILALVLGGGALAAACLAGLVVARVAIDALAMRVSRGAWPRVRDLWLVPVKDVLLLALWPYALVSRSVQWRGTPLRLGRGTRLVGGS